MHHRGGEELGRRGAEGYAKGEQARWCVVVQDLWIMPNDDHTLNLYISPCLQEFVPESPTNVVCHL